MVVCNYEWQGMIRNVGKEDIPAICEIYNYYVKHTIITFEEEEVGVKEMEYRIGQNTKYPWIVFEVKGNVIGYAYASLWKGRSAYRFSAESTMYLDQQYAGRGIGSKLYESLISELKKNEVHSLIGGIALPNEASIALHEKFGFKKGAHFKEVGRKFDR